MLDVKIEGFKGKDEQFSTWSYYIFSLLLLLPMNRFHPSNRYHIWPLSQFPSLLPCWEQNRGEMRLHQISGARFICDGVNWQRLAEVTPEDQPGAAELRCEEGVMVKLFLISLLAVSKFSKMFTSSKSEDKQAHSHTYPRDEPPSSLPLTPTPCLQTSNP